MLQVLYGAGHADAMQSQLIAPAAQAAATGAHDRFGPVIVTISMHASPVPHSLHSLIWRGAGGIAGVSVSVVVGDVVVVAGAEVPQAIATEKSKGKIRFRMPVTLPRRTWRSGCVALRI
jgi:hypothetical protein